MFGDLKEKKQFQDDRSVFQFVYLWRINSMNYFFPRKKKNLKKTGTLVKLKVYFHPGLAFLGIIGDQLRVPLKPSNAIVL